MDIASKDSLKDELKNIYTVLFYIAAKDGDYKTSLWAKQKNDSIQRALLNEQVIKTTTGLEKKYETEKKDTQIILQQARFAPTAPIVVSGLPQASYGVTPTFTHRDTTLQKMDYDNDIWTAYTNTDNLSIVNDNVHYSGGSVDTLGRIKYYQALKSLPYRNIKKGKNLTSGAGSTGTLDQVLTAGNTSATRMEITGTKTTNSDFAVGPIEL